MCLGDQPQIRSKWLESIIAQFKFQKSLIVRPSFDGKSGHPLLYSSQLFDEILKMSPTESAKTIMTKYFAKTFFIDIDSDGILYDADTPGDFEDIRRKYFDG